MSAPLEKPLNCEQNISYGEEEEEGSDLFYFASDQHCELDSPGFESEDDIFYSAVEEFSEVENCDPSGRALLENNILLKNSHCSNNPEPLKSSGEPGDGDVEMESISSNAENSNWNMPPEMAAFFNNLDVISELGSGAYGSVYLLKDKTEDSLLVDKICDLRFSDDVVKEYTIMKIAETNSFFLNTMGHLPEPDTDCHHLFMEYFPSIDLHDFLDLNILVFSEVQFILKQITEAVAFLHYNNIMHRDLKPSNILIGEKLNIKLIDFGFSELSQIGRGYCGTEEFCAPEVTAHKGEGATFAPSYGLEIDSYSLGITALYIGANLCPIKLIKSIFDSQPGAYNPKIVEVIKNLNTDGPQESFHDLIYNLISEEPTERLSSEAILSHSFFKKTFTGIGINITPEAIEKLKKRKRSIFKFWKKRKNTKSEESFENRVKQNQSAILMAHRRLLGAYEILIRQDIATNQKKNTFWKKIKNAFKKPNSQEKRKEENEEKKLKNEKIASSKKIFSCGFCGFFKKKKNNCSEY